MRIVNLQEFMKLHNILYTEYNDNFHSCVNFNIKWCNSDGIKNDWILSQIAPDQLDCDSFDDLLDKLGILEEDSSLSATMDFESTFREAMYYDDDDPIRFAIYEKEDIENLISILSKLLKEEK